MILRVITWIIAVWVIYSILSRYIFPVFRITSSTNDHLRKMQDQLKEMDKKLNEQGKAGKRVKKEGDYIDYEELK